MSTSIDHDRWLLPRHQTEYPARARLAETTLHGRREMTFLVLTALYFVATATLVLLGTTRVIDLSALIARIAPDAPRPISLAVPLGVLPFGLSFVASALLCELLGRRRASAAILFGAVISAALVGLMQSADWIDGGHAFGAAAALAIGALVGHACNLVIFDLLRRASPGRQLFARMIIASWLSLALGWAAFYVVLRSGYFIDASSATVFKAMAVGSAIVSGLAVLVLAIPAAVIGRGLALALRVGPSWFTREDFAMADERDDDYDDDAVGREPAWAVAPPAFADGSVARAMPRAVAEERAMPRAVADDEPVSDGVPHRVRPVAIPAYTSAEMQFFADGDDDEYYA